MALYLFPCSMDLLPLSIVTVPIMWSSWFGRTPSCRMYVYRHTRDSWTMHFPPLQPSTGEALREQLSNLTSQQRHSPIGRRSKSSSITGDSSDVELSSPAHSPSHSMTQTKVTSTNIEVDTTQITTASESECGAEGREQVDGEVDESEHLLELPSSTYSSDAGSEQSSIGSCCTPLDDPDQISEEEDTSDQPFCRKKQTLNRSPSLLTLRPSSSELSGDQSDALLGGSPSFLHHPSITTIWQTVVTVAKPQHLAQMCSPSRLISVLIIVL